MKHKMTNAFFATEAQQSMKDFGALDLPIKESIKVIKLAKQISENEVVYHQGRMKLLDKYGTMSEDKTRYTFPDPAKLAGFNKEFAELQKIEFEVESDKILIGGDIKIKPNVLIALEQFIEIKDN
jgi:hypothetical protein